DGTFGTAQNYPVGGGITSLAVGDFNGDSKLDLAVAGADFSTGKGTVSILLGNGDGSFQPATSYPVGADPQCVVVADFNGDGAAGLAVADRNWSTVSILLGQGDGTFNAAQNYAVGGNPVGVAVGDFNRDGHVDLAVTNSTSDTVSVLLGSSNGIFQAA